MRRSGGGSGGPRPPAGLCGWGRHLHRHGRHLRGAAEEIVGCFLEEVPREQIVLGSKAYKPVGSHPHLFSASHQHTLATCDASLRRLQTGSLDLYYLHGPVPVTPLDETLRTYDDLVRQGKMRYVGVSNLFGQQIVTTTGVARWRLKSTRLK
jgi:aryl-alcohol dehydrogenase-like predicted oxidoreductase